MIKVTILDETTKNPYELIGRMAGICWGAPVDNEQKNYKRGLDCIKNRHGRTWEYVEVYMVLEGWSARVIREFYTHIGGAPTRLQESTRYVDCTNFEYVIPPKVFNNESPRALAVYHDVMSTISQGITYLEELGVPREDSAMLLPLGMETKVVVRMNLRTLVDMAHQRLCSRAYWEYRQLMNAIKYELSKYSTQWEEITKDLFVPKCVDTGFCRERNCCGRAITFEQAKSRLYDSTSWEDAFNAMITNWHHLSEDQKQQIQDLMWNESNNN